MDGQVPREASRRGTRHAVIDLRLDEDEDWADLLRGRQTIEVCRVLSCRVEPGNNQSISAFLSDNRGAKARLGELSRRIMPLSLTQTCMLDDVAFRSNVLTWCESFLLINPATSYRSN